MATERDLQARLVGIFQAHRRRVYSYVVSHAGRQFADDVVSETFVVAWRSIEKIPADELPWLIGVARNLLRKRYEREARQASLAVEMRAWIEDVDDIADSVAQRWAVLEALARLSEFDRELLTLVGWHGLSNAQAARVIGCSVATLLVKLHRARNRLANAMSAVEQSKALIRTEH
ncbi:RNA polymerase sigma factor [Dactylosporangium sp. CA-139066]|uniref:RNA polymerase sigma factor n=1 Tax=Dactylosporangium sp. CA-139066 TaxID=3239930 RepID=UPI003D8A37EE